MAHLLMIESWVGANGRLLPKALCDAGHTYTLLCRNPEHYREERNTEIHPVIRYAKSCLVTETNDVAEILKTIRGRSFDGVLTVCDYYIDIVIEVAAKLGVPCPFPKDCRVASRKHLLRKRLDDAGLPNVRFVLADDWSKTEEGAQEIGFPLVMKPVDLASSAFVRLVRNHDELKDAFRALDGFQWNFRGQKRERLFLLEEYLLAPEYSVEVVVHDGCPFFLGVTDKSLTGSPFFIESGHMFPAVLEEDERSLLTDYVGAVLRVTNFSKGVVHAEVKLCRDGPKMIEINPRLPGNYIVELIRSVKGVDLLSVFIELALGEKPRFDDAFGRVSSAAIAFLVPDRSGVVESLSGVEALSGFSGITDWCFEDLADRVVGPVVDNTAYLGYVMGEDEEGLGARRVVENAIRSLSLRFRSDA